MAIEIRRDRQHFLVWLLMLAGVVTWTSCSRESNPKDSTQDQKPFQLAEVSWREMKRTVLAQGSLYPREETLLSVKVPGRLETLDVDIGTEVKKGQCLARIEPEDYQLRVEQAQAVLAQARAVLGLPPTGDDDTVDIESTGLYRQGKARLEDAARNLARLEKLKAESVVAQAEYDTTEVAFRVAKTRLQEAHEEIRKRQAELAQRRTEYNQAKKELADSSILAPFDGIVAERRASLGEYLQVGRPLLLLVNNNPLRLRLSIPERESRWVQPGQSVRISISGQSNVAQTVIQRVSPRLGETNRMLVVESDVASSPLLRAGMFVEGEIVVTEKHRVIAVPEEAVTSFVGIEKAFIVEKGKAVEKNIETGRRENGFVEVTRGLEAGQKVVLRPAGLRTGTTISEALNAKAD